MIRPAFLAIPALLLLSGCGATPGAPAAGTTQAAQPACPRVSLLEEGARLVRYRPGARPSPRALEVSARLTGVESACALAPRNGGLDVTLAVRAEAERGPALAGGASELPYWIAVTDPAENRVLNRGSDSLTVPFAAGRTATATATATARGEDMMVRIPGDPRRAAERVILVSFQLTPEQLEANRRR